MCDVRGDVDCAGQIDDAANTQWLRDEEWAARWDPRPCSGPHCQVPSGGVGENDDAVRIELGRRRELAQMVDRAADVEIRARPAASRLTQTAVFDTPARNAIGLQYVAHRSEVSRGFGPPASTVHEDDNGVRTCA
jgi:hypothetical protein